MSRIVVLGAGLVGSAMAIDLSKNHKVTSVDVSAEALQKLKTFDIETQVMNLRDDNALQNFVKDFDLVIGAVPGFMGFNTVKQVILAGKNMVDISFFRKIHLNWTNWRKSMELLW